MYAVIELKGKQFEVTENQTIYVDLIEDNCIGQEFKTDKVLMLGGSGEPKIGMPYIEGANVSYKVEKEVKGEKLIAFKYKHNKNSKTKKGHRQKYHKVTITSIQG